MPNFNPGCFRFTHYNNEIKLDFKGVPIKYTSENKIRVHTKFKEGSVFQEWFGELIDSLGPNSSSIIRNGNYEIDFHEVSMADPKNPIVSIYLTDSSTSHVLFKVSSPNDLKLFLMYHNLDIQKKINHYENSIEKLKHPRYPKYDQARVKREYNIDIPPNHSGLAPDYSSVATTSFQGKRIVAEYNGVLGLQKITLTGSREMDFRLAFEKMGVSASEAKKLSKDYVWHHASFDPITGYGEMQLVLRSLHDSSLTNGVFIHTGGAAEWSMFYAGIIYDEKISSEFWFLK